MENNNFNNQQHDDGDNTWQPEQHDGGDRSNFGPAQHHVTERPMRRRRLRNVIILIIAAVVILSVADAIQMRFAGGGSFTARDFNVNDVSQLEVSLVNMIVNVQTHNGSNVRVEFTPPSRGRYVGPSFEHNPATGRLRIYEPRRRHFNIINIGFGGARTPGSITVYVPANANIDTVNLRTTNGRMSLDGGGIRLGGDITARTTNGTVDARNFTADYVDLRSTNGAVNIRDLSAGRDITARTTNGRVGADGVSSRNLNLNTTNGAITVEDSVIHELLTARTTNGGINLTNVDTDTNRANLRTTNGRVNIN